MVSSMQTHTNVRVIVHSFTLTLRTYMIRKRKSRAGNTEYLPLIWRILQHDGDRLYPPTNASTISAVPGVFGGLKF